jgi:hypothetical protein
MTATIPQTHLAIAGQFVNEQVYAIRRTQNAKNRSGPDKGKIGFVFRSVFYSMSHISTSEVAGSDFTPEGTISKAFACTKEKMLPDPW